MSLVLDDRVRETTQTTGTGTITLDGAVQGFQSFAVIGNNNTTYYTINRGAEWEVGLGTYYGGTLSRDTVYASSNGVSKVNFSAGSKDVFVTLPAEQTVTSGSDVTFTKVTTPTVQATNSGGLSLKNSAGTTQISMGAGGGDNISLNVSTNLNGTNAQIDISPTGTGHVHMKPSGSGAIEIAPTSVGTIDNMTIGATTPVAGTFSSLRLSGTSENFTGDFSNATVLSRNSFKTSTVDSSTGIYALPNGSSTAASWQASNAADPTNASKILIATNGSTDVQLVSGINGSGSYLPLSILNGGAKQVEVASVPSAVNYFQLKGSVTTLVPSLSSQGTDSNISMAIQPKGTGAIDLAAGSSGVNISNGGTVTAITRTAVGSAYTSIPTPAITAPTTAGGVQATATANMFLLTESVASGGTGYTVGDVLTIVGGTNTATAQVTVSTVSSGVITAVTNGPSNGIYSVLPTSPASVTGGTGTGATFNLLTWGVYSLNITAAGSGYVEQPTVSFSGGGGSGATAYASVGGTPFIKSISRYLDTYASGGQVARFDSGFYTGVALTDFLSLVPSNFGGPTLLADNTSGSGNLNLRLSSSGTSAIDFFTNRTGQRQLQISHTASAVNYVQVTGNGTTGSPTISTQGSDTNISMQYLAKGSGVHAFQTGSSFNQFRITATTSAVNYLAVTGAVAGAAPVMSVAGSDTDIDLTLTPKGAGAVRFGTHTGTILTPTGYITIKDSGGTSRRLLVG